MKNYRNSLQPSVLMFFLLTSALSLPFYLLGFVAEGLAQKLPINLPASALMFVCPLLSALILEHRTKGMTGVKTLLARVFDHQRIKKRVWYLPTLLLMPFILFLAYWAMRLTGVQLPKPHLYIFSLFLFTPIFFISAVAEEVGWTGYATDALQERWGTLTTGLFLGVVWAVWHVLPYAQAHHTAAWIVWQCIYTVAARVLLGWLYNNTGKSLFAVIVCHASMNIAFVAFPNNGSHYDPFFVAILACVFAIVVSIAWRPLTFVQQRNSF